MEILMIVAYVLSQEAKSFWLLVRTNVQMYQKIWRIWKFSWVLLKIGTEEAHGGAQMQEQENDF